MSSSFQGRGEAQFERVPVRIFPDPSRIAKQVAKKVATLIENKAAVGEYAVLGLPTGSTPIGVYQELIRMHREENLDFSLVKTFNLDEYYPMNPESIQSYHRFMWDNFFSHINIKRENTNIPEALPKTASEIETLCHNYEHKIQKAGGLDILLLGIGRSGHIGFNEPGSNQSTRTRKVVLDEVTRKDAASDFFGEENVPREAITMGVGTILDAREIILLATGEHKAKIVKLAVENPPSVSVTASFLQNHANATFYIDKAAAASLTREVTPWLVKEISWNFALAKKAVLWLAETLKKPILSLNLSNFQKHHLHSLVHAYGGCDRLCQLVYEDLSSRIMTQKQLYQGKKVLIFSPHPDDDVICMGGMMQKLIQAGNDCIAAYCTNGSVAVFDRDVIRHLRFVEMSSSHILGPQGIEELKQKHKEILDFINSKRPGDVDPISIQKLKANIRYTEAMAAVEVIGMKHTATRFLDLPFYQTGMVRKKPIGEDDVNIVLNLLRELKPDHIYLAGDLSDPHGTHRMCYYAIREGLVRYVKEIYATEEDEGMGVTEASPAKKRRPEAILPSDPKHPHNQLEWEHRTTHLGPVIHEPTVWLYRGSWVEYEVHETDVFLPLSQDDLQRKIDSIYRHESQKDRAAFPGSDPREFWQRARDRNMATAKNMDQLGLPEFHAVECFVKCDALALPL